MARFSVSSRRGLRWGGGHMVSVVDLDSALEALAQIVEQGEGAARTDVWDGVSAIRIAPRSPTSTVFRNCAMGGTTARAIRHSPDPPARRLPLIRVGFSLCDPIPARRTIPQAARSAWPNVSSTRPTATCCACWRSPSTALRRCLIHPLEYGLWNATSLTTLRPVATALLTSVRELQKTMADVQLDPHELSIRAHEITETALQFELTGESDFGSHSALATIRANLDGTQTVLDLIRSLLAPRYPGLARLDAALTDAKAEVDRLKHGVSWPPLTALPTSARERLDSTVSELSEMLAPVASILEPRRA